MAAFLLLALGRGLRSSGLFRWLSLQRNLQRGFA
jgi:hypothetical protein